LEAFLNVVENGVRYNREGGSVMISAVTQNGNVAITVADTGMGIAASDFQKIFGRFYRTANVRATEGTGLGLSIVKSLLAAHGGTIRVESELGVGSRFMIVLPFCSTG
jgi:signal transduction histidine kinase